MAKDNFSVEQYLESFRSESVLSLALDLAIFFQKQNHLTSEAMPSLFCCGSIQPYRPQILSHEPKLRAFQSWAAFPRDSIASQDPVDLLALKPEFAVQLVRQVNYGPLESKRYFVPNGSNDGGFLEISENDLIQANFQKLNAYKNYKCDGHNKFFEVNLYQKDPVNMHHWRANLARPATDIDL